MKQKIGRLTAGKYFVGPEPFGCFNSGFAPMIWRPRAASKQGVAAFYIVGPEMFTLYVGECFYEAWMADRRGSINFRFRDRDGWVFRSKKAAERQFYKLIDARVDELRRDREKVNDLREKARNGDVSAVLELGDYGVL